MSTMRFPSLEVMVNYGVYTVKDLEHFSKGLMPKRNVRILSECKTCACVHGEHTCTNCSA
jgi:hypothetical protein